MNDTTVPKATPVRGRYSDEERGYVLDTLDCPLADVASHLGRTENAVSAMRRQVRSGYEPTVFPWTAQEDDIIRMGAKKTSAEIATQLPGRTENTVKRRRFVLGAQAELKHKDPNKPGKRTVIAKTCKQCGLLLPASWYRAKNSYSGKCKKCESDNAQARASEGSIAAKNTWDLTRQEISLRTATARAGNYSRAALFARQIKSSRILGDKEVDQWLIDNPNIDRLTEITDSLRKEILATGRIHPEWDWDD